MPSKPDIGATLIGESSGYIKKLPGFKKHHFVPDSHSDATLAFVRNVGAERIQTNSDELYQTVRKVFGFKRKQLSYSCEDAVAQIETPDFTAELSINQDEDPSKYLETTQVTELHNETIALDPRFHYCFNNYCDILKFDFPNPINIEDKIDAIEDIPLLEESLDYAADGSSLELKLKAISLRIYISTQFATFQLMGMRDLSRLIEHTQKTLSLLSPAGFPSTLTGK